METKALQQLANHYGIRKTTLLRWFAKAEIEVYENGIIKPEILQYIYEILGKSKNT